MCKAKEIKVPFVPQSGGNYCDRLGDCYSSVFLTHESMLLQKLARTLHMIHNLVVEINGIPQIAFCGHSPISIHSTV